ncbi:MAG TPA: aldehyde dehydrogenase family protein [Myxococcota bacterium]|nr:aldehyde dehydrogenase family protein [Myxococcota bacterium]HOC99016.1 aldehyde dehydrogenase family protein [Myxococcota bacterium]HOH77324.1 aldehyde dehydrogenase family protein [Myxococcota bacterium]
MACKEIDRERQVLVSMNPATFETLGEVHLCSADEVRGAVDSAQAAFPGWAALTVRERAGYLLKARDYMLEHADEIAMLISRENGKPLSEALNAEVLVASELITRYAARAPELLRDRPIELGNPMMNFLKESRLVYRPLGVISVVSPWNYPFSIPIGGLVFSLITGNTVVFKPASDVAMVGMKIDEILNVGGQLPKGVLNTVIASGRTIGETLFSPPVRRIVFTGSTEVGRTIQGIAAKNFIPTSMELGGKDPMVVLEDADLDLATSGAVWGAFTNCGQVCASVERVYVAKKIYDRFVEMVVRKTRALRVGVGQSYDIDIGAMANEEQYNQVLDHIREAVEMGAKIECGGKRPEGAGPGYFIEPTVLTNVTHDMKAVRDETFGPLMPIIPFDTVDEAVRMANDSVYGLCASVWTKDRRLGREVAKRIESGTVAVNDAVFTFALVETPWQGMKESGVGRSHSDEGLLEFVFPQHINEDRSPGFMRRRMWWFPYSEHSYNLLKSAMHAFANMAKFPSLGWQVMTKKSYRNMFLKD